MSEPHMKLDNERHDWCPKCDKDWDWNTPSYRQHPERLDYICPNCGYVQHVKCVDARKKP